jgi:hypothetical protein
VGFSVYKKWENSVFVRVFSTQKNWKMLLNAKLFRLFLTSAPNSINENLYRLKVNFEGSIAGASSLKMYVPGFGCDYNCTTLGTDGNIPRAHWCRDFWVWFEKVGAVRSDAYQILVFNCNLQFETYCTTIDIYYAESRFVPQSPLDKRHVQNLLV